MAQTITLGRTGDKMPAVGLGTWKIPNETCAETVYTAIKCGYRLIDGAADYGNEKEAGEGVRRAIEEGIIKREDIFITSKLWNTFHAPQNVKASIKHQLALWGLDYLDLFLVHFPIALANVPIDHKFPPGWFGDDGKVHLEDTPLHETWKVMEELVDQGLVKNIGLSNCNGSILLDVLRYARIKPQVLQIERHPYLSQEPLIKLTEALGIAMIAYSSLGPQGYIEISLDHGAQSLLAVPSVVFIASKHNRTPAQVLLRWSTQRNIAVIPKSDTVPMLTENLKSTEFDLDKKDLEAIGSLNVNIRMNNPVEIDPRLGIFA
ncbi:Aldo/keto reductase [Cyathus striatus]|nr:Aldo/keto reductase [Cyathus striatus]